MLNLLKMKTIFMIKVNGYSIKKLLYFHQKNSFSSIRIMNKIKFLIILTIYLIYYRKVCNIIDQKSI